jgi:ComF family protein
MFTAGEKTVTTWVQPLLHRLRGGARLVLDALLPPQCLGCSASVEAPGNLCAECFNRITFIAAPFCEVCGIPLPPPVIDDVICGACLQERPAFEQARAVVIYGEDSRGLALRLKHADRTDTAIHLARWMQRAGQDVLARCDVIVPVPLHRWRLFMRTYNQAALLANALARLSAKPVLPHTLRRVKSTPMQGGLHRDARRRNVARAFAVSASNAVEGKRVLLVDDVLTTSATADACARTLLKAGAARVDVLVLARVPTPGT